MTDHVGYLTSRLSASSASDRCRVFRSADKNFAPHLPDDRTAPILDIGAGRGFVLDYLRHSGYTSLHGIDIDAECVAACADRHSVELVEDTVGWLRGQPSKYAMVILKDVISHLSRDEVVDFLRAIRGSLRKDGSLVIETFNGALPSAAYTLANDLTHKVAYTEHSLQQALILAGFEQISVIGALQPVQPIRGRIYLVARRVYCMGIQLRLGLERGFGNNPTILAPKLIAVARGGRP